MFKKKTIIKLACTTMLLNSGIAFMPRVISTSQTVQASSTSVAAKVLGIDVASYQSADLTAHAKAGSQFAIVKVSEGTSYRNPKGASQIKSAIANEMMPMGYHFATFSSNASTAKKEAQYAISSAQALGLPKGSYLACDYETGQGNIITNGKTVTAKAIIAFMDQIKAAGYQPLLYASSSVLQNNIDTPSVVKKYPNSLWVAAYAISGRVDKPNFKYFPSMDGVAIWQFTDNWKGMSTDGNITILPLSISGSAVSQAPTNSNVEHTGTVMYKSYVYDSSGNRTGESYKAYTSIKYYGNKTKLNGKSVIKIGENKYVMASNVLGNARTFKQDADVYRNDGSINSEWKTYKQGSPVKTYGPKHSINNESYYRVGKNAYVKANSFK
ncbi:GH25 family lysozyme [Lactobacillus acidophilus]|uniref:GH25 family lysozyme n=1 Tax=Lactobacillus acidophilus TaxID=1579 RepID=UPI0019BBC5B1|nr:SLAP domain-containing protein [Lactobacillus sp.]